MSAVFDEPVSRLPVRNPLQGDLLPAAPPLVVTPIVAAGLESNAKNVQTLIRAQYEVPKAEAEKLMDLIPGVFVETCELDSGHPETAILQVTTDKETQKWMSGFLLRIYPQSSITKIRQQNAKMISDGYAQPNDLAQDTPQHE